MGFRFMRRGLRVSNVLSLGKSANSGADGGESVLAGGGKMFREPKFSEGIERRGGDFGGRGTGEKIAKKHDQAAHERRLGIAAEVACRITVLAGEPDDGNAAMHAVDVSAFGGWQGQRFARTIDDRVEPFVGIFEHREVVTQMLEPLGEEHAESVPGDFDAASPRVALKRGAQRAVMKARCQPRPKMS